MLSLIFRSSASTSRISLTYWCSSDSGFPGAVANWRGAVVQFRSTRCCLPRFRRLSDGLLHARSSDNSVWNLPLVLWIGILVVFRADVELNLPHQRRYLWRRGVVLVWSILRSSPASSWVGRPSRQAGSCAARLTCWTLVSCMRHLCCASVGGLPGPTRVAERVWCAWNLFFCSWSCSVCFWKSCCCTFFACLRNFIDGRASGVWNICLVFVAGRVFIGVREKLLCFSLLDVFRVSENEFVCGNKRTISLPDTRGTRPANPKQVQQQHLFWRLSSRLQIFPSFENCDWWWRYATFAVNKAFCGQTKYVTVGWKNGSFSVCTMWRRFSRLVEHWQ